MSRLMLTDDHIQKMTYAIHTISSQERDAVRGVLTRLAHSGGIDHRVFHEELIALRKEYAITESAMHTVEEAFFGSVWQP